MIRYSDMVVVAVLSVGAASLADVDLRWGALLTFLTLGGLWLWRHWRRR